MKYAIFIAFFFSVSVAHADIYIQKFQTADGEELLSHINSKSLAYLLNKGEAPDMVFKANVVAGEIHLQEIRTSSLFKPKIALADELPMKETLKMYADAMANVYGANKRQLRATIQCESGWEQKARGKAGEIGIAQYMPNTFKLFEKEFGEDLSIHSAEDQIKLTAWAFSEGYQKHWTCWRNVGRKLK